MNDKPKNVAASVHARLLNIARERQVPFNVILPRYAIERLLYRLSKSRHASRFVLKGAMLFELWSDVPHRSTRDLDLLGFGDGSLEATIATFREVCAVSADDDGLHFEVDSVRAEEIKALDEYVGTRVRLLALLGSARIPMQIDIGLGDAIVPPAEEVTYPTLLEFPAPQLRAYSMETVIAEKLHAIVVHGMPNTRMKDYFDLYYLSQHFAFSGQKIRESITATFERRGTAVPSELPLGLTAEFSESPLKQTQWNAFLRKLDVKRAEPLSLPQVVDVLVGFFSSLLQRNSSGVNWKAGGPWT